MFDIKDFGMSMRWMVALLVVIAGVCSSFGNPGDFVVVPRQESLSQAKEFLGSRVSVKREGGIVWTITAKTWEDRALLQKRLEDSGLFEAVTEDRYLEPAALPDDPSVDLQWHLSQISAPRAWDYAVGNGSTIVAVVDAGCEISHPDLAPNLVPGYNTISGLPQSSGGDVSDIGTTGHGTRCMGIAVAKGNNGIGGSGVGWNLRGMPVRATNNTNGSALISELLEGVTWAVNNGAKVVSVSYSGVSDPTIEAVGAWARTQGALLVWAAGNDNTDLATFDHENVTIVGGTDQSDQKISLSNYGRAVDCFAPATQVFTTRKGGLYGNMPAGTSAAAPQVAAALALMMEREPTLTPAQIEKRLFRRCRDLGTLGNDDYWGWGRINAGTSVGWPTRTYDWSLLPVPSGLDWASSLSLNNAGRIVGNGGVLSNRASTKLISWLDGAIESVSGFQSYGYDPNSEAFNGVAAINEAGQVVFCLLLTPNDHDLNWSTIQVTNQLGGGTRCFYWDITSNYLTEIGYGVFPTISETGKVSGSVWGGPPNQLLRYGPPTSQSLVLAPNGATFAGFFGSGRGASAAGAARFSSYSGGIWWTESTAIIYNPVNGVFQLLGNNLGTISRARIITRSQRVFGESGSSPAPADLQPTFWDPSNPSVAQQVVGPDGNPAGNGKVVLDVNEQEEILGLKLDTIPPQPWMLDGLRTGNLAALLTTPFPPGWGQFKVGRRISDRGEMVGSVTDTLGRSRPVHLKPNDARFASIGFGADGANPVYIGSIPPALSITFTDANGQAVSGTTANVIYNSAMGRVALDVPSNVGPTFRIYVRANRDVIPGYMGPRFLPRLIPPMSEPPAPRDVAYLPTSGPAGPSGFPSIQLFAGDCDGSGEIDAVDIDFVIADFGIVNGDPGFDGSTDVDGSGEVDAIDIDVVIANFGLTGDPEP